MCYACPTNKEHNSIQASIFKKHIQAKHPSINSNENPLDHTIIIEADIFTSVTKNAPQKIDTNNYNLWRCRCNGGNKTH